MGTSMTVESHHTRQETVLLEAIEKLGEHELLRTAAAFAPIFSAPLGTSLIQAAAERQIVPAQVTHLIRRNGDLGALALVEGQPIIFGQEGFLRELGLVLQQAERKAGRRLEEGGHVAYYVTAPQREHCLGIVGIRRPQ